jgi:effector-binding domain-containing protein
MPYTVTKTKLSPQPVLVIRRQVMQSGIPGAIAEALPRLFQFAQANQIAVAGPPICRYIDWGPGPMTIEPGIPVAGTSNAPKDPEIKSETLPGGSMAATLHSGAYEQLPDAHAALQEWIAAQGLTSAGGLWERYITDPAQVPDPQDWKTEVFWPVK